MVDAFDIAIRGARLRDRDDWLADIGIKDGRITKIGQRLEGKAFT
jgi:dihydroorotase-like cyclic amidohydrolase